MVLTIKQVSEKYNVHANTVRRWIERDGLEVERIGRIIRIDPVKLEEFISKRNKG